MALRDPRFALSVVLVPRAPWADGAAPLPALATELFGEVTVGRREPIDRVLLGPYPDRVLGRLRGEVELVLSGLGQAVALTAISRRAGELEREPPVDELRADAVAALSGGDEAVSALTEQLSADEHFDVAGLVEIDAALSEGIAGDVPDVGGWRDLAGLHVHRAAGVGEGHAAWQLRGWFVRRSDHVVMDRRLDVLTGGHQARTPPLLDFGASAVRWGTASRAAERRSRALEAVVAEVRAATAAALGGAAVPEGLSARLARARVSLAEVVIELQARRPGLLRAATRVLGDGGPARAGGPLLEASARAVELTDRLATLEGVAARWADALDRSGVS